MRLDIFLFSKHKNFSRSLFQKFIRKYGVKVNEKLINKPHFRISDNDNIKINDELLQNFIIAKNDTNVCSQKKREFLFKGKEFVVINKLPFIRTEDLIKDFLPVHRLDKDTSGVLVAAKNKVSQARLQKQWQDREVEKTYVALVKNKLEPKRGAIEGGIFRSFANRQKMAISSSIKARNAYTEYEVLEYFDNPKSPVPLTLVKLFPKTGRTHQIRVHLSSIDHPVIGDDLYGDKELNKKFEEDFKLHRQFLHAYKLIFQHPTTKKRITYCSRLPNDLAGVLKRIGSKAYVTLSQSKY